LGVSRKGEKTGLDEGIVFSPFEPTSSLPLFYYDGLTRIYIVSASNVPKFLSPTKSIFQQVIARLKEDPKLPSYAFMSGVYQSVDKTLISSKKNTEKRRHRKGTRYRKNKPCPGKRKRHGKMWV
jgi:hypothetical protein